MHDELFGHCQHLLKQLLNMPGAGNDVPCN